MFETELKARMSRIFGLPIVRFDLPSETPEQQCIFLRVDSPKVSFRDNRQHARVTGQMRIFANLEKMPYGFFAKRINEADPDDIVDFFFHDIEENSGYYKDIVERAASFVFFFDSQYDPSKGTITSIDLETE